MVFWKRKKEEKDKEDLKQIQQRIVQQPIQQFPQQPPPIYPQQYPQPPQYYYPPQQPVTQPPIPVQQPMPTQPVNYIIARTETKEQPKTTILASGEVVELPQRETKKIVKPVYDLKPNDLQMLLKFVPRTEPLWRIIWGMVQGSI